MHDASGLPIPAFGHTAVSTVLRTPYFRKHLGVALVGVLLALGLFYFSTEYRTGVPEFDGTIFAGLIVSIASATWRTGWTGRNAGAPRIRVFAKRDALGFVTLVVTAICFYTAGRQFGWSSIFLAYATGFGFGFSTGSLFTYFGLTQLDLRENGIVMQGGSYWTWEQVKMLRWNRENDGRLVLARGWRRLIATVPPEQRKTVDAVLKEKLGTIV